MTTLPSPTRPLTSPGISRLTPPRVFFTCLIAALLLEPGLRQHLPHLSSYIPLTWSIGFGVILMISGFLFMMRGHRRFQEAGTTVKTRLPATTLVTTGSYRFSRNPMYVGFVAILFGLGMALDNTVMMLMSLLFFVYLDRFVIRREERYLRQRFGIDYDAYCSRVRRWL